MEGENLGEANFRIVIWKIILRDSLGDILRARANAHFSGFSFCADLRTRRVCDGKWT
jgi:hypothetical protein